MWPIRKRFHGCFHNRFAGEESRAVPHRDQPAAGPGRWIRPPRTDQNQPCWASRCASDMQIQPYQFVPFNLLILEETTLHKIVEGLTL